MDRKEAARILDETPIRVLGITDVLTYIKALEMAVAALQEPEREKGQWELIEEDWNVYRCSACGEDWVLETATPQENNMNFCPSCGADMRGEEE